MTLANSADLSDEIPNKFPLGLKVGIAQMRSGLCEVYTVCTCDCESQDGLHSALFWAKKKSRAQEQSS